MPRYKRLNDEEIRNTLIKADSILDEYQKILTPVLRELAKRKEEYTGYKYNGEFGCYECGIDTLCIHIKGNYNITNIINSDNFNPYQWEEETRELFSGLQNIFLRGHF